MHNHCMAPIIPEPSTVPYAGVAESVLSRVMDAFLLRMHAALMTASVKALSANPALTRLMAAEVSAPQAGDPVAFFTGRQTDNVDAFVTDVIHAGLRLCPGRA